MSPQHRVPARRFLEIAELRVRLRQQIYRGSLLRRGVTKLKSDNVSKHSLVSFNLQKSFNVAAKILKRHGGPSAAVGSGDCFKASKQDSSCNSSRVLINHRFKASNCTSWSRSVKILSKVLISPLFTIFNRSRSEKSSSSVLDPVHGANPWKARAQCSPVAVCWQTKTCRDYGDVCGNETASNFDEKRTKHASLSLNKGAVAQMERTVKDMMESAKAIDELRLLGRSKSISLECGSNPARARIGVVITMANNVGNTPSTLSFCIDVRGKAGENRFADVHELRLLYLEEGLIDEAVKVVATVANHVLITRGIEKTTKALVSELKNMSKEVEDSELADVAAVSAGNNYEVGNMIVEAMSKVGRKGIVTLEEGKRSESNLRVVEGMQSDRGYISSYFVTDGEKMADEKSWCEFRPPCSPPPLPSFLPPTPLPSSVYIVSSSLHHCLRSTTIPASAQICDGRTSFFPSSRLHAKSHGIPPGDAVADVAIDG
nr:ruBisCO large subunit-binding protein subunit beta, chloroplastic [Ipomoea batatas]